MQRLRVVGLALQPLAQELACVIQPTRLAIGTYQQTACKQAVGCQCHRLGKMRECFVLPVQQGIQRCQIGVCVGKIRIQRNRAQQGLLRFIQPVQAAQQDTEVVQHLPVGRVQFGATRIGHRGVIEAAFVQQYIAQVVMPRRHCGVLRDGLADQLERLRGLAALLHRHPQEVRGISVIGLGLQHHPITFFGRVETQIAVQLHRENQHFRDRQLDFGRQLREASGITQITTRLASLYAPERSGARSLLYTLACTLCRKNLRNPSPVVANRRYCLISSGVS